MATTAKYLGANLIKLLTGRVSTSTDRAALNMLQVATDGTQQATKFITTDTAINQGVAKVTALHIGSSGSEVQVNATGAEINQAFDLSAKGEIVLATRVLTVADNNKILFLSAVAGFTTTLPVLSTLTAGWRCRIIIKTALTSASYIITETTASDTNKIVTNFIAEAEVTTGANGPNNSGHTTITFVNGTNVVGDWVDIECDGSKFYVHGYTGAAAGGITLA